jgi:hypothetical protein
MRFRKKQNPASEKPKIGIRFDIEQKLLEKIGYVSRLYLPNHR